MKKKLFKLFFTAIFILMSVISFSQKDKPLRVEIEAKKNSDSYNIVPLGKNGLIMFYETDERSKGNKTWEFTKYNTDLKEVWTQEIPIPVASSMIKYFLEANNNNLYILLGSIKRGTFQVINLNTEKGTNKVVQSKLPGSFSISDFKVINNKASIMCTTSPTHMDACLQGCFTCTCIPAFTGLTVFKYNSYIVNESLENGSFSTTPIKYKGNSFVISSDTIEDNVPFIKTFIRNKPSPKEMSVYMNDYAEDGKLIKTTTLKSVSGKDIISAKYEKTGSNEAVMIGTFSTSKKKGFSFNPASDFATGMSAISEGIYFSKFNDGEQDFIKFYPFSKFENFLSFLNKDVAAKVKKKQSKAEKKGKEVNYNYYILIHRIIKKNDEYIMIGEAYYPEYREECNMVYSSNGGASMQCHPVFVGFRYTHAVIAAFDKDGEMLWDNCFPIEDILTFNLKERVKVMTSGEDIILAYNYGGAIKSQIIHENKVTQGKEETKIETNFENDKVKNNWASDMDFWYDNYFLTWGYQKIKNSKDKDSKGKRMVFYFNKIGLQ